MKLFDFSRRRDARIVPRGTGGKLLAAITGITSKNFCSEMP